MLALDLDPGRCLSKPAVRNMPRGGRNVTGGCDTQAAELGQLLERIGAQYVADISPSGGRHVYVLFAGPLPWLELRDAVRALALRFSAIDTAPVSSLGGQIGPPGSRHKSGGWRLLTMSLEDAAAVVEHLNRPEVWAALLAELAAELRHVEPSGEVGAPGPAPASELDDAGVPWVPRLGGRASLGAELEQVARTGRWDRSRYPGRSEARQAVLCSAAARGWQLADVRSAAASGAWKGLPALYERRSEPGRLDRLLPLEWRKAIGFVAGEKNVRDWPTSDRSSRPPWRNRHHRRSTD